MSAAANDKQPLVATLESIPEGVGIPTAAVADSGYYSEKQVAEVEREGKTKVYTALKRQNHHRSLVDLAPHQEPTPPAPEASAQEWMAHRRKTEAGRALYKLRKDTMEPVFGIVKQVLGYRCFLLRVLEKVELEWSLVSLAYNAKHLFRLKTSAKA
ncbi:MAG: transposase [Verrucomicrobiota bacterium]